MGITKKGFGPMKYHRKKNSWDTFFVCSKTLFIIAKIHFKVKLVQVNTKSLKEKIGDLGD